MDNKYQMSEAQMVERDSILEELEKAEQGVRFAIQLAEDVISKEHQKIKRRLAAYNAASRRAYAFKDEVYPELARFADVAYFEKVGEQHDDVKIDAPTFNTNELNWDLRQGKYILDDLDNDIRWTNTQKQ